MTRVLVWAGLVEPTLPPATPEEAQRRDRADRELRQGMLGVGLGLAGCGLILLVAWGAGLLG